MGQDVGQGHCVAYLQNGDETPRAEESPELKNQATDRSD